MRCVYCRSKDVELDENSGMYYCKKCQRLLSKDEVDGTFSKRDLKLSAKYNAEDDAEDSSKKQKPTAVPMEIEPVGFFTLILLGFLGGIPGFDIVSTAMIEWANIADEYKRAINARFIARIFTLIIICTFSLVAYRMYDINFREHIVNKINETVLMVDIFTSQKLMQPDLTAKSFDQIQWKLSKNTEEVDDSDFAFQIKWSYLDGAIITGKTFMNILEDSSRGDYTYLLQTRRIVEKMDNMHYRNVGVITKQSERLGENENYYYVGVLSGTEFSQRSDDYNTYIKDDLKDLSNEKFIFYVNDEAQFKFTILRDENRAIIGFAATEVYKSEE